jgi:hypothetical protein
VQCGFRSTPKKTTSGILNNFPTKNPFGKYHCQYTSVHCSPVFFAIEGGQFTEHPGILLCFLQKYHAKFSMPPTTTKLLGPSNQYTKLRG